MKSFSYIIGLLIFFLIGFYAGWILGQNQASSYPNPYQAGFDAGLSEAEQRLIQKGYIIHSSKAITEFSATFIEGQANQISVKPLGDLFGPLSKMVETYSVKIEPTDTQIMRRTVKDQKQYQAELSDYQAARQNGEEPTPPSEYQLEPIELSALKAGDLY
ncbi:hypothetical protein IPJ72_06640 [Candidatus Peregrinibacteria bacterium]|nr:MAG: hypothetical protein IPJ72_06640 [Candidatus Peregrinibacteria bacterium]